MSLNYTKIEGLTGEEALILSVIDLATMDYLHGSESQRWDALKFFSWKQYQKYLSWLNLPLNWLPEGVVLDAPDVFEAGMELVGEELAEAFRDVLGGIYGNTQEETQTTQD